MEKTEKQNKKIEEIFAPEKLSNRFFLYQKDTTRRGRSLYINQLLMHIKNEFPDFAVPIDNAIHKIKALGSDDAKTKEEKILRELRSFAGTIGEISDATHINWSEVRKIMMELLKKGTVRKQRHPVSDDYRDELWFLVKRS